MRCMAWAVTGVALAAMGMASTARADDETPRPPLGADEVELRLGAGVFGRFAPPGGWSRGKGYGDEQCWNAPRAEGRICIKSHWKRERSAKQILDEGLEGIACLKSDERRSDEGGVEAIRRECVVKVGPRKEGRIWIVSSHPAARDAVSVEVQLQRDDKAFVDTIVKAIDGFTYYLPTPKPAPVEPRTPPSKAPERPVLKPGERPLMVPPRAPVKPPAPR